MFLVGFESEQACQDKLTDHQGVGLSTFYMWKAKNSLRRSSFTAVFLFIGDAL